MKVQFTCDAVRWFDKVDGNTYHSVKVTRHEDGAIVVGHFQYGYGEQYKQTALDAMLTAKWLPEQYNKDNLYMYTRENDYPILWNVYDGLKRDCINNTK
jgi:hypothetical protein